METSLKPLFCNDCQLSELIPRLVADELLGTEQLSLLQTRYRVMRTNYDCDYAAWQGHFGEGMRPFNGYTDTTAVTMPITHPVFQADFATTGLGAIGLDLPTWFNIGPAPRVMLIAQDPLRSSRWYHACHDAVVSSPFGQHDAEHRLRGNGGRMVHALIRRLVADGYGVYLTDARKFFLHDHAASARLAARHRERYAALLHREIEIVTPAACVCLGRSAAHALNALQPGIGVLELPHLSGTARGAIVRYFPELQHRGATAENTATCYAQAIETFIRHTPR